MNTKIHFTVLLTFLLAGLYQVAPAQSLYFPPISGNSWDTLSPSSLGWCQLELDSLIDYLEDRDTRAFMLLKDGKIVVEKYYGSFTADSLWYWASAAKSLTAFLVGIAQQEGWLSITDTTSKVIGSGWTSCTASQEEKITIRDQLCMTSGLDDGVPDKDCTDPACLQYLADAGARWAYHNAPYTLLDTVITAATGQTLNGYLQQKVKAPTGMTGLFIKIGFNNVFVSNARSLARYGLLILNKGNWNGSQVMTDTSYFGQMLNSSQLLNPSYGYLWWLNGKSSHMLPGTQFVFSGSMCPSAPPDMVAAMGKNGQMLNVVPSQNLVWLRLGDEPNAGLVPNFFNDTIWQKLNAVMCSTVPIIEIPATKGSSIFPNPVAGGTTVEFTSESIGEVAVRNMSGSVLLRKSVKPGINQIDLTGIPAGIYFVSHPSSKNGVVSRLVVQ